MCSGRCLYDLALLATWRGDYLRAGEKLAEEALRLAGEGHDVALLTSVCFCLGVLRTETRAVPGSSDRCSNSAWTPRPPPANAAMSQS